MNDIEQSTRRIHIINNPLSFATRTRRSQRQRISPSPEPKPNQISSVDIIPSKMTNQLNTKEETDVPKTSSIELDPSERKKQVALVKAEGKLEKAQRLYQSAQQGIEQNISEFLRVTTIPGLPNESKTTNAAYEKRIRTLQETKKELEKKIANYQADIQRIQSGDIPRHYSSSKDILNNIKNKVSGTNSKQNSATDISTLSTNEQSMIDHDNQINLPTISTINPQNFLSTSQNSNTLDVMRTSPSNSISNEIGNSQFYIDANYDQKTHDTSIQGDDIDKSPSTKRRLTDDSNTDFNDRISDHSSDDRFISYNNSKRNTMSSSEYHQLLIKFDFMQKTIDRYELKIIDMQRQMDTLMQTNDAQKEENERLNNELTDLTDIHQVEMSTMKNDLKKLEDKLIYSFNEYWTEMVEKLEKLDTRTTKVEQTQTHSLETEENTHRIITKFVNILLTVFAIILLLLSTIKNLVQSRVHAVILLILVFTWITIHYLPDNYFQKNFATIFKRTS